MLRLVKSALAFSAVALIVLIVGAKLQDHGYHGATPAMAEALTDDALVLAADRHGAVTQTGNGVVSGWRRGQQTPLWRMQFKPFDAVGAEFWSFEPDHAEAWCAGQCPAALVAVGGETSAHGGAAPALATTLREILEHRGSVFALPQRDTLLASRPPDGLVLIEDTRSEELGVTGSSTAAADSDLRRVISGAPEGTTGVLARLQQTRGGWRRALPDVREELLGNICISADGRLVGTVSTRIKLFSFDGPGRALGPALKGGTCRTDAEGITAVVNPLAAPQTVVALRFDKQGRELWRHDFGARRLISPGSSPLIVVTTPQNFVSVRDAASGRLLFERALGSTPTVTGDGALVSADRSGEPRWLTADGPE